MAKKIVFMGTPMFAVPILKSLYQNGYPISDVYTQPPKKSQRGQKINKSPIQGIAETLNLKLRTPKYLKNNDEEYNYFKSLDADLAIVVAYGQIIPKEFLSLTKKGFINIHASLLPKWRGAAPIQRSIMNLDKETYQSQTKPMLSHINVGTGQDLTIKQLAETIAKVTNYQGTIEFDTTKPDGPPRKLMDSTRLNKLGWQQKIDLEEGLITAYKDYKENHPHKSVAKK